MFTIISNYKKLFLLTIRSCLNESPLRDMEQGEDLTKIDDLMKLISGDKRLNGKDLEQVKELQKEVEQILLVTKLDIKDLKISIFQTKFKDMLKKGYSIENAESFDTIQMLLETWKTGFKLPDNFKGQKGCSIELDKATGELIVYKGRKQVGIAKNDGNYEAKTGKHVISLSDNNKIRFLHADRLGVSKENKIKVNEAYDAFILKNPKVIEDDAELSKLNEDIKNGTTVFNAYDGFSTKLQNTPFAKGVEKEVETRRILKEASDNFEKDIDSLVTDGNIKDLEYFKKLITDGKTDHEDNKYYNAGWVESKKNLPGNKANIIKKIEAKLQTAIDALKEYTDAMKENVEKELITTYGKKYAEVLLKELNLSNLYQGYLEELGTQINESGLSSFEVNKVELDTILPIINAKIQENIKNEKAAVKVEANNLINGLNTNLTQKYTDGLIIIDKDILKTVIGKTKYKADLKEIIANSKLSNLAESDYEISDAQLDAIVKEINIVIQENIKEKEKLDSKISILKENKLLMKNTIINNYVKQKKKISITDVKNYKFLKGYNKQQLQKSKKPGNSNIDFVKSGITFNENDIKDIVTIVNKRIKENEIKAPKGEEKQGGGIPIAHEYQESLEGKELSPEQKKSRLEILKKLAKNDNTLEFKDIKGGRIFVYTKINGTLRGKFFTIANEENMWIKDEASLNTWKEKKIVELNEKYGKVTKKKKPLEEKKKPLEEKKKPLEEKKKAPEKVKEVSSFDNIRDYLKNTLTLNKVVETGGDYFLVNNFGPQNTKEQLKTKIKNNDGQIMSLENLFSILLKKFEGVGLANGEPLREKEKLAFILKIAGVEDIKVTDLDKKGDKKEKEFKASSETIDVVSFPSSFFEEARFEKIGFEKQLLKRVNEIITKNKLKGDDVLNTLNETLVKCGLAKLTKEDYTVTRENTIKDLKGEENLFEKLPFAKKIEIKEGLYVGLPQKIDNKKSYKVVNQEEEMIMKGSDLKALLSKNDQFEKSVVSDKTSEIVEAQAKKIVKELNVARFSVEDIFGKDYSKLNKDKKEWLKKFTKVGDSYSIELDDIKPNLKEKSVSFSFDDFLLNEDYNKDLVIKNCIDSDGTINIAKFKKGFKKVLKRVIIAMNQEKMKKLKNRKQFDVNQYPNER